MVAVGMGGMLQKMKRMQALCAFCRAIRVYLSHFVGKDTETIHFTPPANIVGAENTTKRCEKSADAVLPNGHPSKY